MPHRSGTGSRRWATSVKREKGHFDPESDNDESQGGCHCRTTVHGGQDIADIGHIEAAGHNIEIADTKQIKQAPIDPMMM